MRLQSSSLRPSEETPLPSPGAGIILLQVASKHLPFEGSDDGDSARELIQQHKSWVSHYLLRLRPYSNSGVKFAVLKPGLVLCAWALLISLLEREPPCFQYCAARL